MARHLIDANVILRYLLRDDEKLFKRTSELLERVKVGEETVIIPECVLTESVYVLLKIYKVERRVIAEKLKGLLSYKGVINPDKNELTDSFILFEKTQLGIVDCILCAKSINSGNHLFTFDDELKNICNKNLFKIEHGLFQ